MRAPTKQNVLCALVALALALTVLGATTARAVERSSAAARPSAPAQTAAPAEKAKDTPPTRDQILEEGPAALEENCTQCHQPDKWEGTFRDRDGWNAIVQEMSRQMVEAGLPRMSERTTLVIVGYLTLTRPQ